MSEGSEVAPGEQTAQLLQFHEHTGVLRTTTELEDVIGQPSRAFKAGSVL